MTVSSYLFFFISCITLILTTESLRHHENDKLLKQYDNTSDSRMMGNGDLISENNHNESFNEVDLEDSIHNHNGLARWGEGNPYRLYSNQSNLKDDEEYETTEEKYSEEHRKENTSPGNHEEMQTEQSERETLNHQHESIVNWGGHETEYYENIFTIMNKTKDSFEKDENRTFHNDANGIPENISNNSSLEPTPMNTDQSLTHNLDSHGHYHHDYDFNNDENTTDSLLDKKIIDHLVDPLLSDIYVANNHSTISTQTDNEEDDLKAERSCRKCIKWQQLQLTLPCLLYPINFDAPQQVNQTKIIYVHVMRKVIAHINKSLNELLLELEP
uniref:GATA zinc finger domain-containing protein 14-like n=1 Tax=Schistosoma mansoni TaxID=6183 RepID=A0A3Q0KKU0_SCHMA